MKKIQFFLVSGCLLLVFFIVAAMFAFNALPRKPRQSNLLIIMADGVRHDYIKRDRHRLLGFPRIEKEGSRAEFVMPVFPANQYPNWYSIATGLYPESHGMVQNRMYDRVHQDFFLTFPSPGRLREYWWSDATPIWVQATNNNINVSMYNWDGCEVTMNGTEVTHCIPPRDYSKWRSVDREVTRAIYDALDAFQDETIRLAMIRYPAVGAVGAKYGPEANETYEAVRDLDMVIYNTINELERRKMADVDIYILSDHGMTTKVHTIDLSEYVNFDDVKYMLDKGAVSMIWPKNDVSRGRIMADLAAQQVKGLHYYLKDEIPKELNFKDHRRVLPILLRTDPGYIMEAPPIKNKVWPVRNVTDIGAHGFFAEESHHMRGIFYGYGPGFKRGYRGGPVHQVDHYQMFCHLLGIRASPNNGSWIRVRDYLST
ncbi:Glycerophosphocholine cholinephosphodiesterase ENPP6 [Halotydeus destructor]|nr:Glycerophosphocholine cholinephosphodiesterase ENPP6 [Halotydeus destructor]